MHGEEEIFSKLMLLKNEGKELMSPKEAPPPTPLCSHLQVQASARVYSHSLTPDLSSLL